MIMLKKWDNGYLVVITKYKPNKELMEEYIDLTPILDNLYMDADSLLGAIKVVKIDNDRYYTSGR